MSIPIGDSPAVRRAARPGPRHRHGARTTGPLTLADGAPWWVGAVYGETAWAIMESTPDAIWVLTPQPCA